jgi:hypothetical protein
MGSSEAAIGNQGVPLRLVARRLGGKIRISQVTGGGARQRTRPTGLRGDFSEGIQRFVRLDLVGQRGRLLGRAYSAFCPNSASYRIDELDPTVRRQSSFPMGCGGMVTRRMVWGIDRGWAADAATFPEFRARPGRYTLRVTVDPGRRLLDARRSNNSVDIPLKIVPGPPPDPAPEPEPAPEAGAAGAPLLPDLRALPAFGVMLAEFDGKQELSFSSTVWNAGPGPIWVEGRRSTRAKRMETEQVIPRRGGGTPARRRVNDLVFDLRDGHAHWHYNGLARYRLLRPDGSVVATDAKQGFCFLPTDAVDLGVPGAVLVPPTDMFGGAFCGRAFSVAVRMRLDAGWGDTYGSGLPGQAIDVSKVPDGTYFVEVLANATGRMLERSRKNNVSRRRIVLASSPEGRVLKVPPLRGFEERR